MYRIMFSRQPALLVFSEGCMVCRNFLLVVVGLGADCRLSSLQDICQADVDRTGTCLWHNYDAVGLHCIASLVITPGSVCECLGK